MDMKTGTGSKKSAYLEAMALAERLHRQFLELLEAELHQNGIEDINSVQALVLYNIGDDQPSVGDLVKRGYYLGTNATIGRAGDVYRRRARLLVRGGASGPLDRQRRALRRSSIDRRPPIAAVRHDRARQSPGHRQIRQGSDQ